MHFEDPAGSFVDLEIVGYESPEADPGDHDAWAANWLVIAGSVRAVDGRSWTFREPVLTTRDVAALVAWLRQTADGRIAPAVRIEEVQAPNGEEDDYFECLEHAGWLTFLEPELRFAVGGYDGRQVQVLIVLGYHSAPPPIDVYRPSSYQIAMKTGRPQLRDAAAALERELAAYPAR